MTFDVPERYNVSTILDANLDAGRGDEMAIRCDDERLTYAQLHDRVCRVARALRELGIQAEQRVLMVLDDTPWWPAVFLGAIRIGAIPVPVSYLDTTANLRHYLRDTYARVVVVEASALEPLDTALEGQSRRPPVVVAGGDANDLPTLDEVVAAQPGEIDPEDTHRDDPAFWLYSGGSTGVPKGVVHLQHDIPYTCHAFAREILAIEQRDVTFSTTKLYHAYGLGNNLSFPYSVGACTVLLPGRPTPQRILEAAARFSPTLFFSVPTLYGAVVGAPEAEGHDLGGRVRMCVSAAEPLAPEVLRRWRQRFGLEIIDGIGSTEMLHIYCSNRPGDVHPGTSGRPVPGYELRLLDEDDRPVGRGEVGNLFVKGDSALAFYWHQHAKTKAAVRGDWYFTGDRYRETDEGVFVYEGRADDMIKIGGLWASPIEIENALMEHPRVLEAAAVGVEADYTTRVKAYVVCREDAGDEELATALQSWCKERLRRYEYPHFIEFVDELPKTLTGKIQRYKLREQG
jgi:benzoate-CoA ligase family protein